MGVKYPAISLMFNAAATPDDAEVEDGSIAFFFKCLRTFLNYAFRAHAFLIENRVLREPSPQGIKD